MPTRQPAQAALSRAAKVLLALLACVLVLRLVSLSLYPLMDTTEARYAEMARKILETGNWTTPQIEYGVPFWGKPILSFWASAATMKLVGVNEFGARLAPFFASLLCGALFFAWPFRTLRFEKAVACNLVLHTTLVGFVGAGAVMTDGYLFLGLLTCMVAWWKVMEDDAGLPWKLLFFVGLAVGLLAKGPLTLVLAGVPLFLQTLLAKQWRQAWRRFPWLWGLLLTAALVVPWYWAAERATPGFLHYFIVGEHFERYLVKEWAGDLYGGGHARPLGMIWVFGLLFLLPWLLVAPWAWRKSLFQLGKAANRYLLLWLLWPLVFFTAARNILPAYTLPCLGPFAILVVDALFEGEASGARVRWVWYGSAAVTAVVVIGMLVPAMEPHLNAMSHKRLLEHWDRSSELVYLDKRPYSAQFYSGGKARVFEGFGEGSLASPEFAEGRRVSLAMKEETFEARFVSRTEWRVVARDHGWCLVMLFRRALRAPATHTAP